MKEETTEESLTDRLKKETKKIRNNHQGGKLK